MKKKQFIGYTIKNIGSCWTILNTLNMAAVIQKNKHEAIIRYGNDDPSGRNIIKVKVTIEQIKEEPPDGKE